MNFSFYPSKTCLYKLVSLMDDKMVLDVSQDPKEPGKVIVFEYHGSSNQKFAIREVPNNKFAIFCARNNMVLVPEGGHSGNGTRIVQGMPKKEEIEFWSIEPATHPKLGNRKGYFIRSYWGKALDVAGQSCKNHTPVIQWDKHGNQNQIWLIQQV